MTGPSNSVHYVYAAHGAGADKGDIYYVRSTDNGATWSAPLRIDQDGGTRGQWQPSLGVTPQGHVFASWYDQRNTANDDLQRFGRLSTDNGLTWQNAMPVSDVIFPKPLQPDPGVQPCYTGDYDRSHAPVNGIVHTAWTDGRVRSTAPTSRTSSTTRCRQGHHHRHRRHHRRHRRRHHRHLHHLHRHLRLRRHLHLRLHLRRHHRHLRHRRLRHLRLRHHLRLQPLSCAAGDRTEARCRKAADPQGQLPRRQGPPRSHQASAPRPRRRSEPEARRHPARGLPGQPAGWPAARQQRNRRRGAPARAGASLSSTKTLNFDPRRL